MSQNIIISLLPEQANEATFILQAIHHATGIPLGKIKDYKILKRSIDARSRVPKIVLQIAFVTGTVPLETTDFNVDWNNVTNAKPIYIIGAGPAGMFAALHCIALGRKPILIERGKDVRSRRRDLAAINKEGVMNSESNYCFGEGGAGTYSDGKLYTRATKRGDVQHILKLFVHFGADENILIDTHPHIGTNKLPKIIAAMREQIIACGGDVYFDKKLTDILISNQAIKGIVLNGNETIACDSLLLATGHSARDIFELLHRKNIFIESKPFALGVRIEHPQALIDSIQYKCSIRNEFLPPASYSLVTQAEERGVFSFCMCPGGIIAPAATSSHEIVVNGWSPSKRNNPFANSGTVVAVNEQDYARYGFTGSLAGMHYQQMVEQRAYQSGGGRLVAPAQRMDDFINHKNSSTLPSCSYLPGITAVSLKDVLPREVSTALHQAIKDFGKKMKGYYTREAVLVATESRTSSPVRIPRDKDSLQHIQIKGLYPCAEGAGYAGGIVSAAIDGVRCVEAMVTKQ